MRINAISNQQNNNQSFGMIALHAPLKQHEQFYGAVKQLKSALEKEGIKPHVFCDYSFVCKENFANFATNPSDVEKIKLCKKYCVSDPNWMPTLYPTEYKLDKIDTIIANIKDIFAELLPH